MSPKVSVIIPIYNAEKFLARCLDSVVNQSLSDLEIICVNDGSTDHSLSILEKYSTLDKRITIVNQDNRGQGAARNSGMNIVKGEYIGFVDSDDWIDINYFEKLYNAAKKYSASIACCGIIRKYPFFRVRKKLDIKKEEIYSLTQDKYAITETPRKCYVYNKIYKRKDIEKHKIRFPEGVYFEDVFFTIRALYYLGPLVTVSDTVYYYWVNYESTTRQMHDKKQKDLITARTDFIEFSRSHHINCDEKYYIRSKIFYKLFGIPIIKVYEWETIKKYYLFSLIPVFEKRISL
ncbi:MAG: glycosyltransferase [Holosporaceae bacterium]|jgi:glycosyltransferase involved in cell wall biosynthesis|nr:glycosyltransferase [Holosporaceae bacterium]